MVMKLKGLNFSGMFVWKDDKFFMLFLKNDFLLYFFDDEGDDDDVEEFNVVDKILVLWDFLEGNFYSEFFNLIEMKVFVGIGNVGISEFVDLIKFF